MAAANTTTQLEITKNLYGPQLEKLAFEETQLTEAIPLSLGNEKLGDQFIVHVPLTMEHGFTYNGTDGGEVTLAAAIAQQSKRATVPAYEVIAKSRIVSRTFEEALSAGPAAFGDATQHIVDSLMVSAEKRREHSMLYGQDGMAAVESIDTGVITITAATWTPLLWDCMEGAIIECFSGTGASVTQRNGDLTITAVDLEARTVTVSGTSSAVAPGDILYFKGARTATAYKEMPGLNKLANNTGSLYGIDAASYVRWRPNRKTSTGLPSFSTIQNGIKKVAGRGVRKMRIRCYVSLDTWEVVNNDMAAARVFDASYGKGKGTMGNEVIEFVTHSGTTIIEPHALVRPGDAFAFGEMNAMRIGVHDLKFDRGPTGDGDLWHRLEATNTYEIRIASVMGLLLRAPWRTVAFSGITYS